MLVRSRTDTNIMLAMPKPPTSMANEPMTAPTMPITPNSLPTAEAIISGRFRAKLSSSRGFRPRTLRITPRISYSKSSRPGSSSRPFTAMEALGPPLKPLVLSVNIFVNMPNGMMQLASLLEMVTSFLPSFSITPIMVSVCPRALSCWPRALPLGNRFSAMVAPTMATGRAASISCVVK